MAEHACAVNTRICVYMYMYMYKYIHMYTHIYIHILLPDYAFHYVIIIAPKALQIVHSHEIQELCAQKAPIVTHSLL